MVFTNFNKKLIKRNFAKNYLKQILRRMSGHSGYGIHINIFYNFTIKFDISHLLFTLKKGIINL